MDGPDAPSRGAPAAPHDEVGPAASTERPAPRPTLSRSLAIVSAAAILGAGVLLAHVHRTQITRTATEGGEHYNVALTRAFSNSLWLRYREFLTASASLSSDELRADGRVAALRHDLLTLMRDTPVVRVKVFDLGGRTVFSTEPRQIGEQKGSNGGFLSARGGRPASELSFRNSFSAFEGEIEDRNLLSSYVPLTDPASGRIEAVFEVYTDLTPLLRRTETSAWTLRVALVVIMATLYALLLVAVVRADRHIRKREAALRAAARELERRVEERTEEVRVGRARLGRGMEITDTLLAIGRVVGGITDTAEALRRICRELARLTGADTVAAYGADPARTMLLPVAGYHVPPDILDPARISAFDLQHARDWLHALFAEKEVVWSDAVPADARFADSLLSAFGHQSTVLVPLILDGEVSGAFALVWWRDRHRPDAAELTALAAVGEQVGVILRNTRLTTALEVRARRLHTLARLNQVISSSLDLSAVFREITGAAAALMESTVASIWVVDETGTVAEVRAWSDAATGADFPVHQVRIDQGGIGWVLRHRTRLDAPDIAADERLAGKSWALAHGLESLVAVPVLVEDRPLAILVLHGRRRFAFAAEDEELLDTFVSQVGVALRNATLFQAEAAARRAAEEAGRAKSDFLATMSHEVRTPMNGVLGMAELLLTTRLSDQQRRFAEAIYSSGRALLHVVNGILDFSKIEAGGFALDQYPFDPRLVVEDVVQLFGETASAKGVRLVYHVDEAVPGLVRGDGGRVRQILTNLISNAVKFTARGEVSATLTAAPGPPDGPGSSVTLHGAVTDSGIGINPETRDRLFTPFSQGDTSMGRRYGGTGLGLAITKRLVEMMGGTIAVESEPGRGARFTFTVRVGQVAESGRAPHADLLGARILVVDDNATNRMILERQLAGWGAQVGAASDAHEALRELRANADRGAPYHGALVDLKMPDLDGLALGRSVMADPALANTRLVLLSSIAASDTLAEARAIGFTDCLTKPVDQADLSRCLALDANAALPSRSPMGDQPLAGTRMLLAEDNLVNQEVAVAMFEMLGATLDVVPDGRQAVAAALAHAYDLIFMDCQMPEVDGFAAVRLIREQERGDGPAESNGAPCERRVIIALTAHAGTEDRKRCLASGMDDYLAKPFSRDQLLAVAKRWLPPAGTRGDKPAGVAAADANAVTHAASATAAEASPAEDAGEEPAVDPVALERIMSLQRPGSPGLLERIAGLYFTNTPRLLAAMETAIARADQEALRHAAHTLKSTSATLGAARLARLCRETEEAARHGASMAEPRVLDAMHAEYARVRRDLLGALEANP